MQNALAVFFPFYIASEIPSNMILKKTKASIWSPFLIVSWGIVCTLMGVAQSYPGLMVARAFLGLAEGGLFPGVAFIITTWYKRSETGFRIALFFSAATIAGAFGGLLARGIMEMDGLAGQEAWRWIFILEGIVTVIAGESSSDKPSWPVLTDWQVSLHSSYYMTSPRMQNSSQKRMRQKLGVVSTRTVAAWQKNSPCDMFGMP